MALTEAQATAAANAIIDRYAPGAPADVKTAAKAMLASTIRHGPETSSVQFADQQVEWHNLGPALIRRCGAASMLAPWRRPRARAIGADS